MRRWRRSGSNGGAIGAAKEGAGGSGPECNQIYQYRGVCGIPSPDGSRLRLCPVRTLISFGEEWYARLAVGIWHASYFPDFFIDALFLVRRTFGGFGRVIGRVGLGFARDDVFFD